MRCSRTFVVHERPRQSPCEVCGEPSVRHPAHQPAYCHHHRMEWLRIRRLQEFRRSKRWRSPPWVS